MTLAVLTSCGGSGTGSNGPLVTLDEFDDYFDVKSWSIENDAKEKGIENLGKVSGTFTFEVKRNKEDMKLKPSDILYAEFEATVPGSWYKVMTADCDAVIKNMAKMEKGESQTFTIKFKGVDPGNDDRRQQNFDALNNPKNLEQICIDIELKGEDDDDD